MTFIQKLRKKPKSVRRRILYLSTLIVAAIIIFFWVATLPYRLSETKESVKKQQTDLKPLNLFKKNVSESFGEFSGGLQGLKGLKEGLKEEVEGMQPEDVEGEPEQ